MVSVNDAKMAELAGLGFGTGSLSDRYREFAMVATGEDGSISDLRHSHAVNQFSDPTVDTYSDLLVNNGEPLPVDQFFTA